LAQQSFGQKTDIFLDANRFLPSLSRFNTHPDSNAVPGPYPLKYAFSDYPAPFNGIQDSVSRAEIL